MFKIKHERTADCVVAGYWVHKSGEDAIGSLPLDVQRCSLARRTGYRSIPWSI
jgi:ATP-dependent DNA ligase